MAEDKKEERDDADAGTLLKTAIDSMERLHKRMDAMEEEKKADAEKKRADSEKEEAEKKKADAEKEEADKKKLADAEETIRYFGKEHNKRRADDEEEEKPEKVAADKKKADEDMMDAKKKADAEKEEEEKAKADAERVRKDSELHERLAQLEARTPRDLSDEDRAAYSDAQARADSVYHAFGKRAPSPLLGEGLSAYRKRLVSSLKTYSDDWKDVDLHAIADEALFNKVERNVYADAMMAANNPQFVPAGTLMPLEKHEGGHTFITYKGQPRDWMDSLSGPVRQHVTSILTPNGSAR